MPIDYDTLDDDCPESLKRDDFPSIFADLIGKINWKIAFFLYIFATLIFSDLFVDSVLAYADNTSEAGCPTTKGSMIQITFLILAYIFIDILVQAGIL